MNHIVVEIKGGCLRAVYAREPVGVTLVDWDSIEDEYNTDSLNFIADLANDEPGVARIIVYRNGRWEIDHEQFPLEVW